MEYKLWKRLETKDGHIALIHRQRNALLMFRYLYYVTIKTKMVRPGVDPQVIYGWTERCPDAAAQNIRDWSVDKVFELHPYLMQAAVDYQKRGSP